MNDRQRPEDPPNPAVSNAGNMTVFFAMAYITQGIATQFGIVYQPLQYFMMKGLHLNAGQVSSYLAVMMFPWVMKPFYGMVCDLFPLFGYRRKSYFCVVSLLAAGAFSLMTRADSLPIILDCLLVSTVGMAAATAITVGLAVQGGRSDGKARAYFAVQTFFYYSAIIAASIGGGLLCRYFAPDAALHSAALIAALLVVAIAFLSIFMVREERQSFNKQEMSVVWASMKSMVRSRVFWAVALFIWFWDFSPSFGVPLYAHETDVLGFQQDVIGRLAAFNAGGMVIGAVLHRTLLSKRPLRRQLYLAIVLGTASTLAYLLLSTPSSAIALELFRGTANMLTILAIYALAADICPPGMEVTLMAALLAVRSLAIEGSTFIGGQLYTSVFNSHLDPLVITAAVATALCAVLIPFLPHGNANDKQSN
jgi:predicted MFS family arabinose efflux permease